MSRFLGGVFVGLVGGRSRLPRKVLQGLLLLGLFLAVRLLTWLRLLLGSWPAVWVALGLVLALVAWWRWGRGGRRRSGRGTVRPGDGWLPRTVTDPFWVYVITEWRDADDRLLTREAGRLRGTEHLVYVGKANNFERRMEQHQADKAWWHDELVFRAVRCFTESEALAVERDLIETAARSRVLHERPRENRALNPAFDAERSAAMRARASL